LDLDPKDLFRLDMAYFYLFNNLFILLRPFGYEYIPITIPCQAFYGKQKLSKT